MEQEEAMLGATLESLGQVRAALTHGDLPALNRALESQAHTARAADELRQRRAALRRELAAALGVPPQTVTVEMMAKRLPADAADRLLRYRDRLRSMAADVDRLNRANASLVSQSLDFLQRFLLEITGGGQSGKSYTCCGMPREAECGSMIEARG
jgi:hypothetical protein